MINFNKYISLFVINSLSKNNKNDGITFKKLSNVVIYN